MIHFDDQTNSLVVLIKDEDGANYTLSEEEILLVHEVSATVLPLP